MVRLGERVITGGNTWLAKPHGENRGDRKREEEVRGRHT